MVKSICSYIRSVIEKINLKFQYHQLADNWKDYKKGKWIKKNGYYEVYGIYRGRGNEAGSRREKTIRINLKWRKCLMGKHSIYFNLKEFCSTWFHEYLHILRLEIPELNSDSSVTWHEYIYNGEDVFKASYKGRKRIGIGC